MRRMNLRVASLAGMLAASSISSAAAMMPTHKFRAPKSHRDDNKYRPHVGKKQKRKGFARLTAERMHRETV